jgi:hypothetical protein
MLQALNMFIDTFQGAKSQFVKTYVQNEEIARPLNTYINAQTAFAKNVAQEVLNFSTTVGTSMWTFDAKKAFATK